MCEEQEIRIIRKEEGQGTLERLASHSHDDARNPIGQILGPRLCQIAAQ
jgi:hypothetical protein